MSSNKLQVIKIPNPSNDGDKKGEPLARMPRMYLELLENKNKVKPNMLNKEYEPSETSNQDNDDLSSFSGEDSPKKMDKISERDEEESEISDFSFQKKSDKSLSDSDEISTNGSGSENESIIECSVGPIVRQEKHCFHFSVALNLFKCFYTGQEFPEEYKLEEIEQ